MPLRRDAAKKRFRPGELARLLDVSEPTLRKLSVTFRDYLDDAAARRQAGTSGRSQRRYTERDERTLRYIVRLVHDEGLTYDAVLARLARAADEEAEQSTSAARSEVEELRKDNVRLREQVHRQEELLAELNEEIRRTGELVAALTLANEALGREAYDLRLEQTLLRGELWETREKLRRAESDRARALWSAQEWRREARARWPVYLWRAITARD